MAIDEDSVDPAMSPSEELESDGHVDNVQCQKRQRVSSPSPAEVEEE